MTFPWNYKEDKILNHQHIGIFYKVNSYNNEIKKEELSSIAKLELEKLGYTL